MQPLYRINSDDDLLGNHKTIYVDDEPEEEVVHVVHRPRPKPKEKIIYVDEEEPTQKIVYVDRPPSPKYVIAKQPSTQVVYAQQQQPQVIYQQQAQQPQVIYQQPQQQVVYASPKQPQQYVYYNEPNPVQYVVQQPDVGQPVYYDQQGLGSNYVYVNDPVLTAGASNQLVTVPASNIVYR